MPYEYRPRDPRGKLREVVRNYLRTLRTYGRGPNRGVVFGDVDVATTPPQTTGWLLSDRRPGRTGTYLLLADGDVYRVEEVPGATPELGGDADAWFEAPTDDLVTLLARSLADVRAGGDGWLASGEGVIRARDRRREQRPYDGPERRRPR